MEIKIDFGDNDIQDSDGRDDDDNDNNDRLHGSYNKI